MNVLLWSTLGFASGLFTNRVNQRLLPTAPRNRAVTTAMAIGIITAAIFAVLMTRLGLSPALLAYSCFTAHGICLATLDLTARRLPNTVLVTAYATTALLLGAAAVGSHNDHAFIRAVAVCAVSLVIFGTLYLLTHGQLGGGDVKLAGLLGLVLGWLGWDTALAGLWAGLLIAAGGVLLHRAQGRNVDIGLPLGTYLITGSLTVIMLGVR
jgi:leader peptidase (prepilin peptidase) / N-methyltransferase